MYFTGTNSVERRAEKSGVELANVCVSRWSVMNQILPVRGQGIWTHLFIWLEVTSFFQSLSRFANLTALSLSLVMTKALENPGVFKGIWIQRFFLSLLRYTLCCLCVVPGPHQTTGSKQGKHKMITWLWITGLVTAVPVWRGSWKGFPRCLQTPDSKVIFRTLLSLNQNPSNSYKTSVLPHVLQTC